MNLTLHDAIVAALCYADIFDYPLTEEEVKIWLPYLRNYPRHSLNDIHDSLRPGRRLFETRKKRAKWAKDKWMRARRVAKLLRLIPTIKLVGVTGGLTRSNVKPKDDIDFLIITAPKTLWVTRALSTILLDVLHLRRRPSDTNVRDLVCLNMFMSEDGLTLPQKERDLFTAHEVLLMTLLWDRDSAYANFLRANAWVRKILPNAWQEKVQSSKFKTQNHNAKLKSLTASKFLDVVLHFEIYVLSLLESVMMKFQLSYMRKRRSTEIVTDTVIRFHPRDARVWIKRELGERLTRFNVPLDKIFYGR